jgi:hypothetical protein
MNVSKLKRTVNFLVYLSVALGLLLLPQIYGFVPTWLFYSVLAGWFVYLLVAIVVASRHEIGYPLALVLSILTLAVSLPQPEHYSFASKGMWLATFTFAMGSLLQIAVIISVVAYLVKKRKSAS